MITTSISLVIISLKSLKPFFSVVPLMADSPNPMVNDNKRAVITSISGGMATLK